MLTQQINMIISAVLLLNAADSESLTDASQRIAARTKSLIVLGESSLPHITIAQFEVDEDLTGELWEAVRPFQTYVTSVVTAGLSFVPARTSQQLWVELQILKSPLLIELQDAVAASSFCQTHTIKSSTADKYRPHCTLGLLERQVLPEADLEEFSVFNREYNELQLVVGLNGDNFTFTKVKFS